MQARLTMVVVVLTSSMMAGTLPDDATLSRMLYRDVARQSTLHTVSARRHLDNGPGELWFASWAKHPRQLARFRGESSDSSTVDQIIELTRHTLKFRSLSRDGSGRPEGLVLPSGVYTLSGLISFGQRKA